MPSPTDSDAPQALAAVLRLRRVGLLPPSAGVPLLRPVVSIPPVRWGDTAGAVQPWRPVSSQRSVPPVQWAAASAKTGPPRLGQALSRPSVASIPPLRLSATRDTGAISPERLRPPAGALQRQEVLTDQMLDNLAKNAEIAEYQTAQQYVAVSQTGVEHHQWPQTMLRTLPDLSTFLAMQEDRGHTDAYRYQLAAYYKSLGGQVQGRFA